MEDMREIRIVIREPTPGWWLLVKAQARREQRLIGGLVVLALQEYLDRQARIQQEPYRSAPV